MNPKARSVALLTLMQKMWPTPRAEERQQHNSADAYVALSKAVKMWPTPRSNSAMAATITKEADPNRYPNLETALKKNDPSVVGGQLSPAWTAWLMGFPLDWLDLDGYQNPELDGLPPEYLTG